MPVVIEELSTSFQVHDEVKIRRLVRDEIKRVMAEQRRGERGTASNDANPSDPGAAGGPNEGMG
jgi:hypothetical protein